MKEIKNQTPTNNTITRAPFPASKKVYVDGTLHPIKVAMREITTEDLSLIHI